MKRKKLKRRRINAYDKAITFLRFDLPCSYCGKIGDRLEFHHRNPGEKHETIGQLVYKGVQPEILFNELSKCDPICPRCHDKLHPVTRRNRKLTQWERKRLISQRKKEERKKNGLS